MSMAAFADGLPAMTASDVSKSVLDETGLKGEWNFDLTYMARSFGQSADPRVEQTTIFQAIDRQLGLHLEESLISTSVIVVDSVSRTPTENPPGLTEPCLLFRLGSR